MSSSTVSRLRVSRDGPFWEAIATHPQVAPRVLMGEPVAGLSEFVERADVLPLATESGGFIFHSLDSVGLVRELHTMFRPQGWGREVALGAREAFSRVFADGAQLVVTYEQFGWWRSRPPLSHGWKPAGDFTFTPFGALRLWSLSRTAWKASPVFRRAACP